MASARRCVNRWIFQIASEKERKRERERVRYSKIRRNMFDFEDSHMLQLPLPWPRRTRTAEPRSSVLAAPGKFIDDVESMVEDISHCVDTDCKG